MGFIYDLWQRKAKEISWNDLDPKLRGQTKGELSTVFKNMGVNGSTMVALRPKEGPDFKGLTLIKLSDLPEDSSYYGRAGLRDQTRIATFVLP
jgi:hypothetical protein